MSSSTIFNPLLEESTINPSSLLPSYLEMKFLETTMYSAHTALTATIEAFSQQLIRLSSNADFNENATLLKRLESIFLKTLSRIFREYQLEIQMLITYIIERQALTSSSISSIAEAMFGFRRSKVSHQRLLKSLGKNEMIKAALLLSVGPYINTKLRNFHQQWRQVLVENNSSDEGTENSRQCYSNEKIMKKTFVYLYPFLHMTKEGLNLAYNFMYMVNMIPYYNPSLHTLGQIIRRTTIHDKPTSTISTRKKKNSTALQKSLNKALPAAAFAIFGLLCIGWIGQFRRELCNRRRRMYSFSREMESNENIRSENENGRNERIKSSIPPPMPPVRNMHERSYSSNPSVCPLCRGKRVNPTAAISGFVFCFKCIALHLRENGFKCPITGIKCNESQLVRIYEATA